MEITKIAMKGNEGKKIIKERERWISMTSFTHKKNKFVSLIKKNKQKYATN